MRESFPAALPGAAPGGELYSVLSQLFFLRGVSEEDRAALARLAICHSYPRNNILFYHGDPCDAVYIVLAGRVKISLMNEEGREMVLSAPGPGDVFGLVGALDGAEHIGTAIVASDCRLARVPRERFTSWFEQRPHLHHPVLTEFAGMLRKAYEKLGEQALLPVKRRLLGALLELARSQGTPSGVDGVAFVRPTHQELAELVGSSREVISRLLKELIEEEDDLSVQGRVIRLTMSALVMREEF
jgi:CRP-like cAMP-binding protein